MHYLVIMTGSCGNCYVFHDQGETLIIDDGITYKKLSEQLAAHEIPLDSVKGMLLTHLHPDHAKGVRVFMKNNPEKPVFISSRAHKECVGELLKLRIDREKLRTFNHNETIEFGSMKVTPFRTSHDSAGSSGYFIETISGNVFVMTDTGVVPDDAFSYARDSKLKFIEANYDDEMLENGPYSPTLRRRVRGAYGHLSNKDSVDFAKRVSQKGDHVYFVHISENNNTSEKVRELAYKEIPSGIFLKVCERGEMVEGFLDE